MKTRDVSQSLEAKHSLLLSPMKGAGLPSCGLFSGTLEMRALLRIHWSNVCEGALQSLILCKDEELVLLISKYKA